MKALFEIFSAPWSQALGWALIHSVWQAAIICLIVFCLFRFIGNRQSNVRYMIALTAFAIICVINAVTFLYLKSEFDVDAPIHGSVVYQMNAYHQAMNENLKASDIDFRMLVQSNMPWLLALWLSGAIIFSLRTAGGWWYTSRLRKESIPLGADWANKLNALAYQLGIKQWVEIASSASISSPVVFGYLKPIILVPASMLTGLTPEQIETIFLHELAHIKRNDYIINLIQSVVESIYFFNPFVWIISSWIRTEREHCCDDTVVAFNGNVLQYARALAKLEEVRTENPQLVLGLSGNGNQLFNRIRRIMERSARKYPARERIIPVILLILGITCASWITVQTPDEKQNTEQADRELLTAGKPVLSPGDSIPDRKARRNRNDKRNNKDEQEEAQENVYDEEIIENFEYDFELDNETFGFPEPAFGQMLHMNPFDFHLQIVPPLLNHNHQFKMHFNLDSLPGHPRVWNFEYHETFDKDFQENFSDFYEAHREELDKMMADLDKKFRQDFNDEFWQRQFQDRLNEIDMDLSRSRFFSDSAFMKLNELETINWQQHMDMAKMEEEIMNVQRSLQDQQMQMMMFRADAFPHRAFEATPKITEKGMDDFRAALKTQLMKDGYLSADEEITSMQWNISDYDCSIRINGKSIKEQDLKKYRELHDQYFKKGRNSN